MCTGWSYFPKLTNWLTSRLTMCVWLHILYGFCLTCNLLPILCFTPEDIEGCTTLCPLMCIHLSRCYTACAVCTFWTSLMLGWGSIYKTILEIKWNVQVIIQISSLIKIHPSLGWEQFQKKNCEEMNEMSRSTQKSYGCQLLSLWGWSI